MFHRIIVPIDIAQKDKAPAMIAAARQLMDGDGEIILCNIVEVVSSYEIADLAGELRDSYVREAKEILADIASKENLKADIEVHLGHAAMTILDLAKEKSADMIVLASHRPGLQDYFLGSTSGRVVRHATCSVLVLR